MESQPAPALTADTPPSWEKGPAEVAVDLFAACLPHQHSLTSLVGLSLTSVNRWLSVGAHLDGLASVQDLLGPLLLESGDAQAEDSDVNSRRSFLSSALGCIRAQHGALPSPPGIGASPSATSSEVLGTADWLRLLGLIRTSLGGDSNSSSTAASAPSAAAGLNQSMASGSLGKHSPGSAPRGSWPLTSSRLQAATIIVVLGRDLELVKAICSPLPSTAGDASGVGAAVSPVLPGSAVAWLASCLCDSLAMLSSLMRGAGRSNHVTETAIESTVFSALYGTIPTLINSYAASIQKPTSIVTDEAGKGVFQAGDEVPAGGAPRLVPTVGDPGLGLEAGSTTALMLRLACSLHGLSHLVPQSDLVDLHASYQAVFQHALTTVQAALFPALMLALDLDPYPDLQTLSASVPSSGPDGARPQRPMEMERRIQILEGAAVACTFALAALAPHGILHAPPAASPQQANPKFDAEPDGHCVDKLAIWSQEILREIVLWEPSPPGDAGRGAGHQVCPFGSVT